MKCGILTFHRAQNYGGILQAYALQKSVEKLGHDCEIVDYRSPFIEKYYKPISLNNLPSIKRMAAILIKNGRVKDNRLSFNDFSDKHLKTSDIIYENENQIVSSNNEYDLFIAGSDQVWSYLTAGFDKNYFLDFVNEERKKNSYAASFGVENIPETHREEYIRLLSNFENISVREEQGAKIVKHLLSKTPPIVLDPTLLLDKTDWLEIASNRMINQEYILLYLIAESKNTISLAKKIAKIRNLKVIYINDRLFNRSGMENKSKVSVNDWVDLFINANCIVTNSFHGVAFSINFKKEFFMQYLPEPAKVNSRLENILSIFNLKERYIEDNQKLENIKGIDYDQVHDILDNEREKSINYLKSILGKSE